MERPSSQPNIISVPNATIIGTPIDKGSIGSGSSQQGAIFPVPSASADMHTNPLSPSQVELIQDNQTLLKIVHRVIVHEVGANDGSFFPFGIAICSDGTYATITTNVDNPALPEGSRIGLANQKDGVVSAEVNPTRVLEGVVTLLQNNAKLGTILTTATCFPQHIAAHRSERRSSGTLLITLEDHLKRAVTCMGTYRQLVVQNTWEFSDLGGVPGNLAVFEFS